VTSPHQHALRFRIWQYASPRGWDVTNVDIAAALDEPVQVIRGTVQAAGWNTHVRTTQLADFRVGKDGGQFAAARAMVPGIMKGNIGMDPS
jgi:hypothetical protein